MVPNTFPSLFWGYAAIFGLLSVYIVYLGVRISRVEKTLQQKESGEEK